MVCGPPQRLSKWNSIQGQKKLFLSKLFQVFCKHNTKLTYILILGLAPFLLLNFFRLIGTCKNRPIPLLPIAQFPQSTDLFLVPVVMGHLLLILTEQVKC